MNYEQANKVKGLAAPVNEVLKGLDVECPECKGTGKAKVWIENQTKNPALDGKCPECIGEKKVKYFWQPKVGEFYLDYSILLGETFPELVGFKSNVIYWTAHQDDKGETGELSRESLKGIIPIIEWEEIERVLEKAGYWFEEPIRREYGSEGTKCHCVIKKRGYIKPLGIAWGDTRIEAVMKAVIELGKELK